MPRHWIRAHYEQLSELERGPTIGLNGGGWANRKISRHRVESMQPLEDAGKNGWWYVNQSGWNHAHWERIVFSDESCFHLCPEDNRRRVWRGPGQRVYPVFTIAGHTRPQQGFMVWGAISFEAGPL
ncbi:transposable element Tc1 transposase [Trichonephila clavipes]|nr:transposable element Tc1 transposase [Trichonephila clavipes]